MRFRWQEVSTLISSAVLGAAGMFTAGAIGCFGENAQTTIIDYISPETANIETIPDKTAETLTSKVDKQIHDAAIDTGNRDNTPQNPSDIEKVIIENPNNLSTQDDSNLTKHINYKHNNVVIPFTGLLENKYFENFLINSGIYKSMLNMHISQLLESIPAELLPREHTNKYFEKFFEAYYKEIRKKRREMGVVRDFFCRVYDEKAAAICNNFEDRALFFPQQLFVIDKSEFKAYYFDFSTEIDLSKIIVSVDGRRTAYDIIEEPGEIVVKTKSYKTRAKARPTLDEIIDGNDHEVSVIGVKEVQKQYSTTFAHDNLMIYFDDNMNPVAYSKDAGKTQKLYNSKRSEKIARAIKKAFLKRKQQNEDSEGTIVAPEMIYSVAIGEDEYNHSKKNKTSITPNGILWVDKMEFSPTEYYRAYYEMFYKDNPKKYEEKKDAGKKYGPRLISFNGPLEFHDLIAFHGTAPNVQWSVGKAESWGCLRMYNNERNSKREGDHILDLFDRLISTKYKGLGVPVVIVP
ncbi:L,D-transpeptidase [Candidatus Woesearchaeota archaeon]|nr:L,D-transpeptidase [Candidatus Woesearchaeota archaeon]